MVQSATATYSDCAYVKFSSMDDVEKAIKRSDKTISSVRIYRSTEQQMRYCYQGGSKRASLPSSSSDDGANSQMDDRSKSRSNSKSHSDESKFLRITGLPWKADKAFVYNLFPGNCTHTFNFTSIYFALISFLKMISLLHQDWKSTVLMASNWNFIRKIVTRELLLWRSKMPPTSKSH